MPAKDFQLCYHPPNTEHLTSSVFYDVFNAIIEENPDEIWLACPYISFDLIKDLLNTHPNWRILTDVIELVQSNKGSHLDFLVTNSERIRDYPDLHAKVIGGQKSAMIGSANFTNFGFNKRDEMSIHLTEPSLCQELQTWFNQLWEKGCILKPEELTYFIAEEKEWQQHAELPKRPHQKVFIQKLERQRIKNKKIQNTGKRHLQTEKTAPIILDAQVTPNQHVIQSSSAIHPIALSPETLKKFRTILGSSTRSWWEHYFQLMSVLLNTIGLTDDDPRLSLSISTRVSVNINRRLVLAGKEHGTNHLTLIFPRPVAEKILASLTLPRPIRYDFKDHFAKTLPPTLVELRVDNPMTFENEFSAGSQAWWLEAAKAEISHCKASPYRKFHQSFLYKMAIDAQYRQTILDQISFKPETA